MKLRNYFDEYCIRDVTTRGETADKSELNIKCPYIDLNYSPKRVDLPFDVAEFQAN